MPTAWTTGSTEDGTSQLLIRQPLQFLPEERRKTPFGYWTAFREALIRQQKVTRFVKPFTLLNERLLWL
jgi:hypothetical protein